MRTIVARNVPEDHMRALREEAAKRNISVNDLLLEMIKQHVERYRRMKAQRAAANHDVEIADYHYPEWLHNSHAGELERIVPLAA